MKRLLDLYFSYVEKRITALLQKDERLKVLYEPPQAFALPVKDSRSRCLVIWFYWKEGEKLTHQMIYDVVKIALEKLKNCLWVKSFNGIEFVPSFRTKDNWADRVVRIAVWQGFYNDWARINAENISKEKPCEGIYCSWYLDPGVISRNLVR